MQSKNSRLSSLTFTTPYYSIMEAYASSLKRSMPFNNLIAMSDAGGSKNSGRWFEDDAVVRTGRKEHKRQRLVSLYDDGGSDGGTKHCDAPATAALEAALADENDFEFSFPHVVESSVFFSPNNCELDLLRDFHQKMAYKGKPMMSKSPNSVTDVSCMLTRLTTSA
jgi:hypothetical protein